MHRQHSNRTLKSLRYGAVHFLLNLCLVFISAALLIAGFAIHQDILLWSGAGIGVLTIISVITFFILSLSWHCPLCMGKIWVRSGCRRHRNAKSAWGISYRLHIALAVLFSKSYRCPYCGEPFSTSKTRR